MGLGAMLSARQTCEYPEMTKKKKIALFRAVQGGHQDGLQGRGQARPAEPKCPFVQTTKSKWPLVMVLVEKLEWSSNALPNLQEIGKSKPGLFLFYLLFCSGATPGRALGTKCGARDCLHARLCILIPVLSLVLPQNHFFLFTKNPSHPPVFKNNLGY